MLRGILVLWVALAAAGTAVAADVAGHHHDPRWRRPSSRAPPGAGVRPKACACSWATSSETGDGAFVQVELVEQTVLGIGPNARIMVGGPVRLKAERTLYALGGWYKLTNARKDGNARAFEFRSPLLEIGLLPGVVVMQLKGSDGHRVRRAGRPQAGGTPCGICIGSAPRPDVPSSRRFSDSGSVGASPPAAFLAELPRPFRDSLPLRADKFHDREVQPKAAPDFTYADVEAWLNSESPFRRQFIERWRVKARDPEFRRGLIAGLASHPEWDPVLFPEKYLPKDPARRHPRPRQLPPPRPPPSSAR